MIVNFAYVSGLPFTLLEDWMTMNGHLWDNAAQHHIKDLYSSYEAGKKNIILNIIIIHEHFLN